MAKISQMNAGMQQLRGTGDKAPPEAGKHGKRVIIKKEKRGTPQQDKVVSQQSHQHAKKEPRQEAQGKNMKTPEHAEKEPGQEAQGKNMKTPEHAEKKLGQEAKGKNMNVKMTRRMDKSVGSQKDIAGSMRVESGEHDQAIVKLQKGRERSADKGVEMPRSEISGLYMEARGKGAKSHGPVGHKDMKGSEMAGGDIRGLYMEAMKDSKARAAATAAATAAAHVTDDAVGKGMKVPGAARKRNPEDMAHQSEAIAHSGHSLKEMAGLKQGLEQTGQMARMEELVAKVTDKILVSMLKDSVNQKDMSVTLNDKMLPKTQINFKIDSKGISVQFETSSLVSHEKLSERMESLQQHLAEKLTSLRGTDKVVRVDLQLTQPVAQKAETVQVAADTSQGGDNKQQQQQQDDGSRSKGLVEMDLSELE